MAKMSKKQYEEAIKKFRASKPGEGLKKGYVKAILRYEREQQITKGFFEKSWKGLL